MLQTNCFESNINFKWPKGILKYTLCVAVSINTISEN